MKKSIAQIACVALPLATAAVSAAVNPGYGLSGHTTTLMIALIVGFAALFAISLNMRNGPDGEKG